MKLTFFGTGTSMGVPLINCTCKVCRSKNPKDRRLRCGAKLETGDRTVLIDASSDLRQQALRFGLARLDGIFITHSHADHVFGLDDTRIFSLRSGGPIRIFAEADTLDSIRRLFWYAFDGPRDERLVKPVFQLHTPDRSADLLGLQVIPIPLEHGPMAVTGYRFGDLAYLTDFNRISQASLALLEGLDVLVLGALRYTPSISHLTIDKAITLAQQIGARRTFFTHLTHEVSHAELAHMLPDGIIPAYDGLEVFTGGFPENGTPEVKS